MPGFDLHTHSTYSDGTATPAENVRLAIERGLEGIAVTDHDTTGGYADAFAAAEGTPLQVVPGIEFSAEYDGASLHVLAYWADPEHDGLREELRRLSDTRFRRGELMVEKLQELGYDVSFERVRAIAGDDLIARPASWRRRWSKRASCRRRRRRSIGSSPTGGSRTCRSTPSIRSTRWR